VVDLLFFFRATPGRQEFARSAKPQNQNRKADESFWSFAEQNSQGESRRLSPAQGIGAE
jgi:hypothetical protein